MGCALGAQERVNKEETQTLPLSITPNQTKPNQTKPNQTKPNLKKRDQLPSCSNPQAKTLELTLKRTVACSQEST
jgi:hypothetical protein